MLALASCSHKNTENAAGNAVGSGDVITQVVVGGGSVGYRDSKPVNAIPKATAFRMNGNYADNVAVTLNADGSFSYFPDPKDITENSKPISLGNGWYLNRQGISANSVFTKYTFDEYSKLKSVPCIEELKASIIPGSKVVGMQKLPFSISEAPQHLDSIRQILNKSVTLK